MVMRGEPYIMNKHTLKLVKEMVSALNLLIV